MIIDNGYEYGMVRTAIGTVYVFRRLKEPVVFDISLNKHNFYTSNLLFHLFYTSLTICGVQYKILLFLLLLSLLYLFKQSLLCPLKQRM